jgi:tetratricopeptide (TPR) repeat protein
MRGQYDSALINLTHALAVKPDYISALRNRALTYLEIKKYDEAIRDFENFLKYSPDDPDIYNAIGVCYRLNGKYPEALTAINKALSIKQDPHFYLNRSYAYNSMKNLDLARKDAMTAKQNGLQLDAVYAKELGIQ